MKDGLLARDNSFSSDLTRLRVQQGMSESELADAIGRTHQAIRAYEAGEVRPHDWTVQALNDVLVGRNAWGMVVTS